MQQQLVVWASSLYPWKTHRGWTLQSLTQFLKHDKVIKYDQKGYFMTFSLGVFACWSFGQFDSSTLYYTELKILSFLHIRVIYRKFFRMIVFPTESKLISINKNVLPWSRHSLYLYDNDCTMLRACINLLMAKSIRPKSTNKETMIHNIHVYVVLWVQCYVT